MSITFLKDVIGSNEIHYPGFLLFAWALFIVSLASILGEILFGIQAHKKAIKQIDDETIYDQKVGGKSSNWTTRFHWSAALSLVAGLISISAFAFVNVGDTNVGEKANTEAATNSNTTTEPRSKAAN